MKPKNLREYQSGLLPEGVGSVERLLNIYESERRKKNFEAVGDYENIHEGINEISIGI